MGSQGASAESSLIKRVAGLLTLLSGVVSVPFLIPVPFMAIFGLLPIILLEGLYMVPWLLSFFAYFRERYVASIIISIVTIAVVGSASAYMVTQYISLERAPSDGFLIPSAESFPPPFSSVEMRSFMANSYDIENYDSSNPNSDLRFGETTDKQFYDAAESVVRQQGKVAYTFTFNDTPGTVYQGFSPAGESQGYELFWPDGNKYLQIEYNGPVSEFTPQQMVGLLKTLTRTVPPAVPPIVTNFLGFGKAVCNLSGIDVCLN
jgi:hypothetical protein